MKSHLQDLSQKEQQLIYGLPYRVGIWMSHADDEAGQEDDTKEMEALHQALSHYANDDSVPSFINEVAKETMGHKDHWDVWENNAFDVLGDCETAITILREKTSEAARNNYKKLLVGIARKVAGAYGEFGGDFEDQGSFLERMAEKIASKIKGEDEDQAFANISAAEDAALRRLVVALREPEDRK